MSVLYLQELGKTIWKEWTHFLLTNKKKWWIKKMSLVGRFVLAHFYFNICLQFSEYFPLNECVGSFSPPVSYFLDFDRFLWLQQNLLFKDSCCESDPWALLINSVVAWIWSIALSVSVEHRFGLYWPHALFVISNLLSMNSDQKANNKIFQF